ncbi:3D domain-containing protein [Candidatus Latescibacterota bacterium]
MLVEFSEQWRNILKFMLLSVVFLVLFPERVLEKEYTVKYKIENIVLCDSLKVDVTWYTSSVRETDLTPFITADGSRVRDGIIAVSRNLLDYFEYGDSLYVEDLGWFEVRDCMHNRWMNSVDIWCNDREYALQNGRVQKWICWNFREETIYINEEELGNDLASENWYR